MFSRLKNAMAFEPPWPTCVFTIVFPRSLSQLHVFLTGGFLRASWAQDNLPDGGILHKFNFLCQRLTGVGFFFSLWCQVPGRSGPDVSILDMSSDAKLSAAEASLPSSHCAPR